MALRREALHTQGRSGQITEFPVSANGLSNGHLHFLEKYPPITDFKNQNILTATQFDANSLGTIFERAEQIESLFALRKASNLLDGKVIASLFYQPSTRTRSMFEIAAKRLGAEVFTETDVKFSSREKGEPFGHTFVVVTGEYGADAVVIRDAAPGYFKDIEPYQSICPVPIINGGDADQNHPVQGLKDGYSLKKDLGNLEGKRVTFVGDIKGSRVVHSSALILSVMEPNMEMNFVAPNFFQAQPELVQELQERGVKVQQFESFDEMDEKKEDAGDALYAVRLPIENYEDKVDGKTLASLRRAYDNMRIDGDWVRAHPNTLIYHPMPIERRRKIKDKSKKDGVTWIDVPGEITQEVDLMKQNRFFAQSWNGIPVSGAVLSLVIGR